MAIFSKRHYDWLATFARENLNAHDTYKLIHKLEMENPNFDRNKFIIATAGFDKQDKSEQR